MDAIALQVIAHSLVGVAEEMGSVLVRASFSPNIKERRDCSTALFHADGRLVAQAAHIPVHLGAMSEAVMAVRKRHPHPGDTYILNDPYRGGTHLPDITLVTALGREGEPTAFAASRAHHDDVGGMTPGSMPAGARSIFQEGLIVPPTLLARNDNIDEQILDLILANVRTPTVRQADLQAQMAAGRLAARRLKEIMRRHGSEAVLAAMDELLAYAERMSRAAIQALPDGVYGAVDWLEGDGVTEEDLAIQVGITIQGDSASVDFSGTAASAPGNLNCPLAVTRSATYFVFQALMGADVPQNHGAYAPIEVSAPPGCLVHAQPPAAVAGGNVETSTRIADVVAAALRRAAPWFPAQSQGTMNNVTLGGEGWTYYETMGGGAGADAQGPGESGVHTGMTNTLNTPIEALEIEFPLRVERYELRSDSGGPGGHQGGEGLVRAIHLLDEATLSIVSDRRRRGPSGVEGGLPGRAGRNTVNGAEVPAKTTAQLAAGDVVEIATPGGGGFGPPPPAQPH